jgi:hypothetical protein
LALKDAFYSDEDIPKIGAPLSWRIKDDQGTADIMTGDVPANTAVCGEAHEWIREICAGCAGYMREIDGGTAKGRSRIWIEGDDVKMWQIRSG